MNQNSELDVRKDGVSKEPEPVPFQLGSSIEPAAANVQPFVPKDEKAELPFKGNLGVLLAGAAFLLVAVLFVVSKIPHAATAHKAPELLSNGDHRAETSPSPTPPGTNNGLPINDSEVGHPHVQTEDKTEGVGPDDVNRTAQPRSLSQSLPANLGGISPMNKQGPWEAPDYQGNDQPTDPEALPGLAAARSEHDALDKPSLVFAETPTAGSGAKTASMIERLDVGIGLPPGTRLRARIEAAANTAVATPVIAVIEYNYERHGEIVVPAGTKVFGHLEAADASGFVGVRLDSMMLPDGSAADVDAAATDLQLRPLRGKVEGRHRGKNILVRSVSGVGQIAATLAGRGSLNQPLSETDLLRERVSDNIAQASDQEVNRLAVTERLVVSIAANTEIYVVLRKPARTEATARVEKPQATDQSSPRQSTEQLRQLLQLQKELNQEVIPVN